MVNLGRSKGCGTCRKRKVLCDTLKPRCQRCQKAGLTCLGYERKKKPVQVKFVQHHPQDVRRTAAARASRTPSSPLADDAETVALTFFLRNSAEPSKVGDAGRGFLKNVGYMMSKGSRDSVVYLAATSAAAFSFRVWYGDGKASELSMQCLGRALHRLQHELQNLNEKNGPSVLTAILLLHFQDTLSAVVSLNKATRTHQDGALALVRRLPASCFQSATEKQLLMYLVNTKISSAIREGSALTPELQGWIDRTLPASIPRSYHDRLDPIGITLANVQHRFLQLLKAHLQCSPSACPHTAAFVEITEDLVGMERALVEWQWSVPEHWHPRRWTTADPRGKTVAMYKDKCEIYPTLFIANTWNTWRSHRITALLILHYLRSNNIFVNVEPGTVPTAATSSAPVIAQTIQFLVDSVCFSIPFYFGNRSQPKGVFEFDDERVIVPWYHNLHPRCDMDPEHLVPTEAHLRHIVYQGVLHVCKYLTMLLSRFAKPATQGGAEALSLRDGQLAWIRGQLIRAVALLTPRRNILPRATPAADSNSNADKYSEKLNDGMKYMSGS